MSPAVDVGTELPPLTIEATPTVVVSTAIATRDFQDVHHDRDSAVARGSSTTRARSGNASNWPRSSCHAGVNSGPRGLLAISACAPPADSNGRTMRRDCSDFHAPDGSMPAPRVRPWMQRQNCGV